MRFPSCFVVSAFFVLTACASRLPVVTEADVVVAGGTAGGVSAACAAAQAGARVFLVAPRAGLGEDITATLRLRSEMFGTADSALARRLDRLHAEQKGVSGQPDGVIPPLQIKKAFDEALLASRVRFLTGSAVVEVLKDAEGHLSGVVIANRNGRQVIRTKFLIDATDRARAAEYAGARSRPFPAGSYVFHRRLVSGDAPAAGDLLRVRALPGVYKVQVTDRRLVRQEKGRRVFPMFDATAYVCALTLPMKDGSARSFAEAEQRARDLTFTSRQVETADTLTLVPPDSFYCRRSAPVGADFPPEAFEPDGISDCFVLGPRADLARADVERLMRPREVMHIGEKLGRLAADRVASRPFASLSLPEKTTPVRASDEERLCEARRGLHGLFQTTTNDIETADAPLPVLAACDVFVAGGGTAGAPAGIAAARAGAKVIVCEYLYQMGGVHTEGLIGYYCFGNIRGFTSEIDRGVRDQGLIFPQAKSEWFRSRNRQAGTEIWYGALVSGVLRKGDRLTGVVVVAPDGTRGIVRCKTAIDATGNADLAAMAGEETDFITGSELAVQGAGQTPRSLGARYGNSDIGFVNDADISDIWYFQLRARFGLGAGFWDQSQIVNSRERRRLRGVVSITPSDIACGRTWPDTVVQPYSNFDTHGMTVSDLFFVKDPGHKGIAVNLPYRVMLPKKLDGLLVTGLGMSAHRDAMPVLRMQPDVQNQGYVAGIASAAAASEGKTVREINIPRLQRHLVEKGIVAPEVLTMKDSFPLSDDAFDQAVETVAASAAYNGLETLLTDRARSLPRLKAAHAAAAPGSTARLNLAHVICLMGDPAGEPDLIAKVSEMKWDKGWNFRGMDQFGRSVSWLDSYLIALSKCHSRAAVPVVLGKAKSLSASDAFSHYRAIALVFEAAGDTSAVPYLSALLKQPEIGGHALPEDAMKPLAFPPPNASGFFKSEAWDRERTLCLRELSLARALYRLGDDKDGTAARILTAYTADPRGAYAEHARRVLESSDCRSRRQ